MRNKAASPTKRCAKARERMRKRRKILKDQDEQQTRTFHKETECQLQLDNSDQDIQNFHHEQQGQPQQMDEDNEDTQSQQQNFHHEQQGQPQQIDEDNEDTQSQQQNFHHEQQGQPQQIDEDNEDTQSQQQNFHHEQQGQPQQMDEDNEDTQSQQYHTNHQVEDNNQHHHNQSQQLSPHHKAIEKFRQSVKQKPIYICVCCHRLLYRCTVCIFKQEKFKKVRSVLQEAVFKPSLLITSAEDKLWICKTCQRHLLNNKLPPQAKANNLTLQTVPEPLQDLNPLEIRLISLRIPFMKLVSLPKGKQRGIHGPAVNVPASLQPVCTLLPRLPNQTHLIPLKLKRKLQYKHAYINNYIRPDKVINALKYLQENNQLYEEVDSNDTWTTTWQTDVPDLWTALTSVPTEDDQTSMQEDTTEEYLNTSAELANVPKENNQETSHQDSSQDYHNNSQDHEHETSSPINTEDDSDDDNNLTTSTTTNDYNPSLTDIPLMEQLETAAQIRGFDIVEISNNGSCMFDAISHQLHNIQYPIQYQQNFRMDIATFMEQNSMLYKHFISTAINNNTNDTEQRTQMDDLIDSLRETNPNFAVDLLWHRYLSRLKHDAWGDDIVLQAIADKYKIMIHVLQPGNTIIGNILDKFPSESGDLQIADLQQIWLGFLPQYHYVSLIHFERPRIATTNHVNVNSSTNASTSENNTNNRDETLQDKEDQDEYDKSVRLQGLPFESCLQHEATQSADQIYSIAPAEGNKPLPILSDDKFEEMANPSKYPIGKGGFTDNQRPVPISISKYANARLLDQDGRFSQDIEYLLALQYAVEHKQVQDKINIAIRQTAGQWHNGSSMTAGLLKSPDKLQHMIRQDKAYQFLKSIRGSPPYWQCMFYEALAMIRQLGIPTWFFTLSAADMQWPETIQSIAQQYGTHYSDEQFHNLSWETKTMWLRKNPITAARQFQKRLDSFFTDFVKSPTHPLGYVTDHIIRIEFQARGSPHAHCLLWVEDAPKVGYAPDDEVTSFIDKYVTCKLPTQEEDDTFKLVNKLQRHCCSSRCRRKGKCRFHYPKPPATRTIICKEPPEETEATTLQNAMDTLEAVQLVLSKPETPPDITMETLLQQAGTTLDNYMSALSYTKQGQTILLRRDPKERQINAYNKDVLHAWQANHDIQFVVNAYAAVMYVASYVLKAEKGMGELLKQAAKEAHKDEIRQQLKKAGSVFLTHREISAQEAAYRVLSLPLRQTSRRVIFINTNPKAKRVSLLLPQDQIDTLDDNDDDIFASSLLDKYAARPTSLEPECLASFAANYYKITPRPNSKQQLMTLQKNLGKLTKRQKECIIRWHAFNKDKDRENYYRSKLMLFLPWRDEDALLGNYTSFEDRYNEEEETIRPNETKYTFDEGDLQEAYQKLQNNGPPEGAWEAVENNDASDEEIETLHNVSNEEMETHLEVPTTKNHSPTQQGSLLFMKERNNNLMTFHEYKKAMRSLNKKQKEIVSYHRQWCKEVILAQRYHTPVQPYQLFLTGPGGVGKSFVIKLLHYETTKLLRHSPSVTPDEIPIILTASTGVAAFNIDGVTAHSVFSLSDRKKKNGQYLPLSADRANTLQTQLEQLKVVIIDEISMIGARTLTKIHQRLQEIKRMQYANTRFGNITVIGVGDLYQLPPIKDKKLYTIPGAADNPTMQMLHGSLWQETFHLHELDEIVRQQDPDFIEILNNVRLGKPDERLKQCVVTKHSPNYKKHALHVFGTNAKCDTHNLNMLRDLRTKKYLVQANDAQKDVSTQQVTLDVSHLKRSETGGLPTNLVIAVGAHVKLTTNISVNDGLSNGARGKIVHIIASGEQVHCILVKFDNTSVGKEAISASPYITHYPGAVPIETHGCNFSYSQGIQISRTQFPLTLAWACTIHTVQGLTVDEIVVNMSDMFGYGHAYVAFSRVKTMAGLQILDKYRPNKIRADPKVAAEMKRLQQRTLTIKEPLITTFISQDWVRISHLNVRGYLSNLQDVKDDEPLCCPDIICFTETHLTSETLPSISRPQEHYTCFRCDRLTNQKGGVAIFVNPTYNPHMVTTTVTNQEYVALDIDMPSQPLLIIAIYRVPDSNIDGFLDSLESILQETNATEKNTVLLGDFNEDLLSNKTHHIKTFMQDHAFQQKITKATTDYGSLLDHIYSNIQPKKEYYEVVDTYYSDHDATFAALQL